MQVFFLSICSKTLERVRTLQNTYRKTLKYKSLERELAGAGEQNVTLFEQVLVCKIVLGKFSADLIFLNLKKIVDIFHGNCGGIKKFKPTVTVSTFWFLYVTSRVNIRQKSYQFQLSEALNLSAKFGKDPFRNSNIFLKTNKKTFVLI